MGATLLGIGSAVFFANGGAVSAGTPAQADSDVTTQFDISEDEPANICLEQNSPNLLINPSFEGQYTSYVPETPIDDCPAGVCTTAQIPEGWTPYWLSHDDNDDPWIIRQPEYKPACIGTTPCPFPNRLRDGQEALQYFTFFSTHEGGAMQQITVTQGAEYCFSGWGHSWSADDSDDAISGPVEGELYQKIGIDPTGGTDWTSTDIVWSDADNHPWGRIQYDEYGLFTVSTTAEAGHITVFVYSQPRFAMKHNDVYWDDTYLAQMTSVYTTSITATNDIIVLTNITETVQISQSVEFSITGTGPLEGYTRTATITDSAGITDTLPFTPTLNQNSGGLTDTLVISVDTTGLVTGTYAADVVITTEPETSNTPIRIPVKVTIVDEISRVYLPVILIE